MSNSKYILSFLLLFVLSFGHAQTKLQVVKKNVTKTWPYKEGFEVNIEGEKAEIVVETWSKNEVKVDIILLAKHPDRAIAEKDLDAMHYVTEQHGKNIYFRNYIQVESGQEKPQASLQAIYTVTLPEECPVYLKNNFGDATVNNLTKYLKLNTKFTNVGLNNLSGETHLQTQFGDIEATGLNGKVFIDAKRSDVTLRDITGIFDITTQYGVLKLFTDRSELALNIDAMRSDVYFFDPNPTANGYALEAKYGNITAPSDLKFNYIENTNVMKHVTFQPDGQTATMSVKISFGDVVIRKP
jgi:hypothetical protein